MRRVSLLGLWCLLLLSCTSTHGVSLGSIDKGTGDKPDAGTTDEPDARTPPPDDDDDEEPHNDDDRPGHDDDDSLDGGTESDDS